MEVMKIKKFWNWIKNEEGQRTLYFDGYIAQDSWLDDDITPKKFKAELMESNGDISVWIIKDIFLSSPLQEIVFDSGRCSRSFPSFLNVPTHYNSISKNRPSSNQRVCFLFRVRICAWS